MGEGWDLKTDNVRSVRATVDLSWWHWRGSSVRAFEVTFGGIEFGLGAHDSSILIGIFLLRQAIVWSGRCVSLCFVASQSCFFSHAFTLHSFDRAPSRSCELGMSSAPFGDVDSGGSLRSSRLHDVEHVHQRCLHVHLG